MVVGWALVVLSLTSVPGDALPVGLGFPWDLGAHFGLYLVLGGLAGRAARLTGFDRRQRWRMLAALALVAAADEAHQYLIPGRDASVLDWIADTIGVVMGNALASWLARRRAEVRLR